MGNAKSSSSVYRPGPERVARSHLSRHPDVGSAPFASPMSRPLLRWGETSSNAEDLVLSRRRPYVLLMFRPSCGYCEQFKDQWMKFAAAAAHQWPQVPVAMINTEQDPALADRLKEEIQEGGVPKVVFFDGSAFEVYRGERRVPDLMRWERARIQSRRM